MSLAIDVDKVKAVLLADGWHEVADQGPGESSFELDAYEFVWNGALLHGGGQSDICATGFAFIESGLERFVCAGPLTAILAVRYRRSV